MIEETAIVTESSGEIAQVRTLRKTTCGTCNAQSNCGAHVLTKFFAAKIRTYAVLNPIGADIGEQVVIGIPERALTNLSFLFYIVPLLSMILAAGVAENFMLNIFGVAGEPLTILSGLLGLVMGLISVKYHANRIRRSNKLQVTILRRADNRF